LAFTDSYLGKTRTPGTVEHHLKRPVNHQMALGNNEEGVFMPLLDELVNHLRGRGPASRRHPARGRGHGGPADLPLLSRTTYTYNVMSDRDIHTGALVWVRRYNGPASGGDSASSLAARGGRVFVTGGSTGTTSCDDYATIAYNS
jgi:hypothetical protein